MCRHLAYVGRPVSLHDLLLAPEHSLATQSWAPRRQRHGLVNADGFGAGWYVPGRPEPVRYRRTQPIWSDASFASLAPTIASASVLAAVRSATVGFGHDESCVAPFTHGRWLFSHNGRLHDFPRSRQDLAPAGYAIGEASAPVDSALLFGVAAAAWDGGAALGRGLADAVRAACRTGGGRVTLLAADGRRVAGTVVGEPLFSLVGDDFAVLASEPYDDDPGWAELPENTLAEAAPGSLTLTPLTTPLAPTPDPHPLTPTMAVAARRRARTGEP